MTIELRPWRMEDASALQIAYRSSPDLDTQLGGARLETVKQAHEYIEAHLPFTDTWRNWAVVADGTPVGNIGLSGIEYRHDTAWAYYWLASAARGNGYAVRALATVAEWALHSGLFRLELGHRVNNPASCQVATGAGFLAEGIERQKLRYGTERFDVETHSRLAIDPHPAVQLLTMSQ